MYTKIFFLTAAVICSCSSRRVGRPCASYDGTFRGTCKFYKHCPSVFQQRHFGIHPKYCGSRWLPLVCCAEKDFSVRVSSRAGMLETPQEVAKEKCTEFFKGAEKKVRVLALTAVALPFEFSVSSCGKGTVQLVVGGTKAELKEFPYMAAVGYPNGEWWCGGTLISQNFVLTAAHCVYMTHRPDKVRLGELDFSRTDEGAQPYDVAIKESIVPPEYNPKEKYNDIALLKLERDVTFDDFVKPACLWTETNISSSRGVATGWGRTDFHEPVSPHLLKVTLNLYETSSCNLLTLGGARKLPRGLVDSMLCAGAMVERQDTCRGDSGGPLVVPTGNEECPYYVIGVTSFGKDCGIAPAIYTKVSSFIPWIVQNIWA